MENVPQSRRQHRRKKDAALSVDVDVRVRSGLVLSRRQLLAILGVLGVLIGSLMARCR